MQFRMQFWPPRWKFADTLDPLPGAMWDNPWPPHIPRSRQAEARRCWCCILGGYLWMYIWNGVWTAVILLLLQWSSNDQKWNRTWILHSFGQFCSWKKQLLKIFPAVSDHFLLLRLFLDKNGLRQAKHLFETFFLRRCLIVSLFIGVYL